MKIEAAILRTRGAPMPYADSRPLRIETIELDPPGKGEVLVRIAAAGLCHSDLSVINGDRPRPLPMALVISILSPKIFLVDVKKQFYLIIQVLIY